MTQDEGKLESMQAYPIKDYREVCWNCSGKGYTERLIENEDGTDIEVEEVECQDCDGTGYYTIVC